ncbi:MAG: VanZ family protein [Bacteroidota bacterium]
MLTTIPTDTIPRFFNAQDKVEHLIAYFVLAVLLTLSLYFQKWSNFLSSKAFLFSVIFLLFYAALDEVHQIFVPGRYCDIYDWLSDAIGGLLGTGLVYLFLRSYLKKRANAVTASV